MNFPITPSKVIYKDLLKIYIRKWNTLEFVILFWHKLAFKISEDLFTEKFTCMYSKELPLYTVETINPAYTHTHIVFLQEFYSKSEVSSVLWFTLSLQAQTLLMSAVFNKSKITVML